MSTPTTVARTVFAVPITFTTSVTLAFPTGTISITLNGASSPTSPGSTPTTTTASSDTPSRAQGGLSGAWAMPATWVLIAYCAVSLVIIYSLCAGGCLRGFDLDCSAQARQARRRERMHRRELEQLHAEETERRLAFLAHPDPEWAPRVDPTGAAPMPPLTESDALLATGLGQGNEAMMAAHQQARALNSVDVSERRIREQRLVDALSCRDPSEPAPLVTMRPVTGPGTIVYFHEVRREPDEDQISVEYAADLERHRQYRASRIRERELQRSSSPE